MRPKLDLIIGGDGLAGALLALLAARLRPELRVMLISADAESGGRQPELLFTARLATHVRAALDPAIVREWPACTISRSGQSEHHVEPVALLDPAQVALELADLLPADVLVTGCRNLSVKDGVVQWHAGAATAATVFSLPPRTGRKDTMGEANWLGDLREPVVADFDAGGDQWSYLQYVPLGGGVTLISRISAADDPVRPNELPPSVTALTGLIGQFCACLESGILRADTPPGAAIRTPECR